VRPSVSRTPRVTSAAASSKATACDDPRRLPSAGTPWARPFDRAHPRYWMGACHRAPRLATRCRLPEPVRRPLLSRRMARQRSGSARSSRTDERCRAPPVDFCNRNDPRTRPRMSELRSTTPAVARWCSFSPGGRTLSSTFRAADGPTRFRELASRVSTGQGSRGWQRRCRPLRDLSHRDRSREELCPDPIDSSTPCREP
jgi:hypothetical protein